MDWIRLAAVGAEFSSVASLTTGRTRPAGGLRLGRLLLLRHAEQIGRRIAGGILRHAHAHEGADGTHAAFVGSGCLHGFRLCTGEVGSRHAWVTQRSVALDFFDEFSIFF